MKTRILFILSTFVLAFCLLISCKNQANSNSGNEYRLSKLLKEKKAVVLNF